MQETFVIVGGGYAGSRGADCLRKEGFKGRIVLVSEEDALPYQRPPLCKKALANDDPVERMLLRAPSFYARAEIEVQLKRKAVHLDREQRRLTFEDGGALDYDKLLLALGGRARRLGIPGSDLPGVHTIRAFADTVGLRADLVPGRHLVVVGAGYIGLETAAVARRMGLDVTVIELGDRPMQRVASPMTSAYFAERHLSEGVRMLFHRSVQSIEGDTRARAVSTSDGQRIDCDVVLIAAGNTAEYAVAAEAGLACEGGILVDDACRTNDPRIWAAGDCTRHPNIRFGRRIQLESVDNALEQAAVAAAGMCGKPAVHVHVPWFWSDQYGDKLQITGLPDGYDEMVVRGDPTLPGFSVWYLRQGELLCMETVNNPLEFMQAARWIGAQTHLDSQSLKDASLPLVQIAA